MHICGTYRWNSRIYRHVTTVSSLRVFLSIFLSTVVGSFATFSGEEMFGFLGWNGAICFAFLRLTVHRSLSPLHNLTHFAHLVSAGKGEGERVGIGIRVEGAGIGKMSISQKVN